MRDYESIFILTPTLKEEESEKVGRRMRDIITAGGGQVAAVENWGRKRLAYEVGKHKKGEYVLMRYKAGPDTVAELERNFKLTDSVIKYITVRLEKEALAAAEAKTRAAEEAARAEEAAKAEGEAPAEAVPDAREETPEAPEAPETVPGAPAEAAGAEEEK